MSMRCRFGTGRHAAVMKTAAADSVSWPEQQYHRNINSAEERAAIHVEERAVAPDFFHRKIPSAHCGITVVVMEFVAWRKIAERRFFPCFFDRVELHLAATSIVIARRLVYVELRRTDLIHEHEVARVSLWIAHRAGNASRKVGNVSGLDLHPFAAQMHLALTLETEHRLVGHVVLVERTFLARRERQHV